MDNFKVSLVKYMCPICGGVAEIDELAGKKIGLWN